jgi:hypothetical protein
MKRAGKCLTPYRLEGRNLMAILPENGAGGQEPYRLVEEIVGLSEADNWAEAKLEWDLADIILTEPDTLGTCLCGHYPIREHCVIRNHLNGKKAVVGNYCVKRFLGLPSGPLFQAFKRIMKDRGAALNQAAVEYAHDRGWLTDGERDFYLNTIRPFYRLKGLSPKQRAWRVDINERVLARLRASRGGRSHA